MISYKIHKKQANDVGVVPFHLIEFIKNNESKIIKVDANTWNNAGEQLLKYIDDNWNGIKKPLQQEAATVENGL